MIRSGGIVAWAVAAAVAGAVGLAGTGYLKGRADGRATIVDRLQADRISLLKDGKEIDHDVLGADDGALCALLGGCGMPEPAGGD